MGSEKRVIRERYEPAMASRDCDFKTCHSVGKDKQSSITLPSDSYVPLKLSLSQVQHEFTIMLARERSTFKFQMCT